MGAKGLQTRRRLAQATEQLLKTKSLLELRVAEIAEAANTSPSTFYLYFQDVPEAVLAAVSQVSQGTPELLGQLSGPWPEDEAYDRAQRFVESYMDYWQEHGPLFRVRNLAADEGDERFVAARINAVSPLLDALAARIEVRQKSGGVPADLHPLATAGALLAMIERIAVIPEQAISRRGVTRPRVVHAAAFFAAVVLGGSAAVGGVPQDAG